LRTVFRYQIDTNQLSKNLREFECGFNTNSNPAKSEEKRLWIGNGLKNLLRMRDSFQGFIIIAIGGASVVPKRFAV